MALFPDPSVLPPIPFVREEKTFTEGRDSWPLVFEVQEGFPAQVFIKDEARKLFERFGQPDSEVIRHPLGAKVVISETLCNTIAMLMMMDRTDYGVNEKGVPRKYTFRHWAILSPRPVFEQIVLWAYDVREKAVLAAGGDADDEAIALGNGSAAPEAPSSAVP